VPTISVFFGVAVRMYYREHAPPHFHVHYNECEATIAIETLKVLEGALPTRVLGLVLEWAASHRDELDVNWQRVLSKQPLLPIMPLE
jgi:hypothetical protein